MATCEAMNDELEKKRQERRTMVMLGDLPNDFLRVTSASSAHTLSPEQQLAIDQQTAMALQHQFSVASSVSGRMTISVVEAKLNKNYGLTRMDPYVRLRVGNTIYETNTDYNGAKNPRWNKSFNCFFISHDTSIHIEIFDECAFSLDERIAWSTYEIPKSVLKGETVNEWIELSGKLGDGKEGSINLVITCQPIPAGTLIYQPRSLVTVAPYGSYNGRDGTANDQQYVQIDNAETAIQEDAMSEEELKQVCEMFPNVDVEIVKAIVDSNKGNKEHSINALLEISDST